MFIWDAINMFEIEGATGGYGKTRIIRDVSIRVETGEVVALLGRNGVGKTTLLKFALGLVDVFAGTVSLNGTRLPSSTARRARAGLGYVPQGRFVFPRLTVSENIAAAAIGCGVDKRVAIERALDNFPILSEKSQVLAGSLSGGQQQILAIARALATRPKVLLLDEPSEGVQPSIVDEIATILLAMKKEKTLSIVVAEQNLDFCLALAERAYILDNGMIAKEATKDQLMGDRQLLHNLLGV